MNNRSPWPESNPNDGPLWVQWWRHDKQSTPTAHALMVGDGVKMPLTDDEARTLATQLGQPLPPRDETIQIPDGHHVEVVPDGLVSLWVTPEVRDRYACEGHTHSDLDAMTAAAHASQEREADHQERDA